MPKIENDSILLVDKPSGMTSFGVVARIRRKLAESLTSSSALQESDKEAQSKKRKKSKVGHTGTLDPFATGLMILVTGKECKNASDYSKLDKEYLATICLGKTSTTGDPEGEISDDMNGSIPTLETIDRVISQFRGEIWQRPPIFSAIKINGARAYKLARDGKEVELPLRKITVYSLKVESYTFPELVIRVKVSSGTYIRSLAVDIGKKLNMGAYCKELRRTSIADWTVEQAVKLEELGIDS